MINSLTMPGKSALWRSTFAAAAVAIALTGVNRPAFAQAATAPERLSWQGDPSAPKLSGVWVRADTPVKATMAPGSVEGWLPWPPPLKAPFEAVWKKRVAEAAEGKRTDDPVRACMPPGMPRFMSGTHGPLLIIQTPGRITLYRDGDPVRRIWLDASVLPKPADLENFSNGNAIGRYEGADLVSEIVGIRDQPIDSTGVPHSDALKIVERFHRVDAKTLKVVITLTDATAYTEPMTTTVIYKALNAPLWTPKEFICTPVTNYHPDVYVH